MIYTVFDNNGGKHAVHAQSDQDMLLYMKSHFGDFIYSILSSDAIVVHRPNGYLLAYIDTATGVQTVKRMSDWLPDYKYSGDLYV